MTCKNCIHYEACMHLIVPEDEELVKCSHYKAKHNLVEAVRCKDCQYRYTANCNAKHERADMDYCSHGLVY